MAYDKPFVNLCKQNTQKKIFTTPMPFTPTAFYKNYTANDTWFYNNNNNYTISYNFIQIYKYFLST